MSEFLISRVKNSLKMQHYTMNHSWLQDCVEYYLETHENPIQEEIITFVSSQWLLCDLREINNENGCLPKNLAKQKCTTLPGKYILQMDKIYDISTSKYKQLEKIRNVSSENVEATENENANQEDKFQAWETKSKRMLQLFLTDGLQDILAIEYKPIRFLKDNLYPGFKLMIKGPVICRKGVILLEETNLALVGGEVESLLIVNAVENVFARALNLEENPDPYNDSNKETQNTTSNKNTAQVDDDFNIDSEALIQIDKQIEQQNSNNSTCTAINEQRQISQQNSNKRKAESSLNCNQYENSRTSITRHQPSTSNYLNKHESKIQKMHHHNSNQNTALDFINDDDDAFLEMIDEKAFENYSTPKSAFSIHTKTFTKTPTSMQTVKNRNDEFPADDEMHDLMENQSPLITNKLQNEPLKSKLSSTNTKSSLNHDNQFPDEDFNIDDFDIKTDNLNDQFNENKTKNSKSSQSSKSTQSTQSSIKKGNSSKASQESSVTSSLINALVKNINTNHSNSSNEEKFKKEKSVKSSESEFENEFDIEFESKMEVDYKTPTYQKNKLDLKIPNIQKIDKTTNKSQKETDNSTAETTGVKRSANNMSPIEETPKIRCLENSPTNSKSSSRKVKSPSPLLYEHFPKFCEFLCDVLKQPLKDEGTRTVVRGKVVTIIKLNLLKKDSGYYFHLEGTITDGTASLEIVFSSKVLEKIIGYSPNEFSQKRRQSKIDPSIKDQLREDLLKAQKILREMDEMMEIELKKNEKALVIRTLSLNKVQKEFIDERVKLLKQM